MPSASTAGVNLHHLQRCCTAWFVCLLISAPATQADKRVYQALVVSATLCNGGEDIIKGALHSVVNWVDLCILLDTGITDNTLQVAKEVAGDKLLVRNLPWPDSFAAARNAALDAAATTGAQWALILDADERILLGPHSTVRDHILNSSADMVNMLHDSLTYHKVRGRNRGLSWDDLQPWGVLVVSMLNNGHSSPHCVTRLWVVRVGMSP